jgi:hypothetical protein
MKPVKAFRQELTLKLTEKITEAFGHASPKAITKLTKRTEAAAKKLAKELSAEMKKISKKEGELKKKQEVKLGKISKQTSIQKKAAVEKGTAKVSDQFKKGVEQKAITVKPAIDKITQNKQARQKLVEQIS